MISVTGWGFDIFRDIFLCIFLCLFRINIPKFKSLLRTKKAVCFQKPWANWAAVQKGEDGWRARGNPRLSDMQRGCAMVLDGDEQCVLKHVW